MEFQTVSEDFQQIQKSNDISSPPPPLLLLQEYSLIYWVDL